jgi:hypothetical protein
MTQTWEQLLYRFYRSHRISPEQLESKSIRMHFYKSQYRSNQDVKAPQKEYECSKMARSFSLVASLTMQIRLFLPEIMKFNNFPGSGKCFFASKMSKSDSPHVFTPRRVISKKIQKIFTWLAPFLYCVVAPKC